MTINLRPEQQRVVDLAVQSGAYQTPGEVPPAIDCFHHDVALKGVLQRRGNAIIEQNEHQRCQQKAAQEGARQDFAPRIRAPLPPVRVLRETTP